MPYGAGWGGAGLRSCLYGVRPRIAEHIIESVSTRMCAITEHVYEHNRQQLYSTLSDCRANTGSPGLEAASEPLRASGCTVVITVIVFDTAWRRRWFHGPKLEADGRSVTTIGIGLCQ